MLSLHKEVQDWAGLQVSRGKFFFRRKIEAILLSLLFLVI